jgi:hypothetical protein
MDDIDGLCDDCKDHCAGEWSEEDGCYISDCCGAVCREPGELIDYAYDYYKGD